MLKLLGFLNSIIEKQVKTPVLLFVVIKNDFFH